MGIATIKDPPEPLLVHRYGVDISVTECFLQGQVANFLAYNSFLQPKNIE